MHRCRRSGQSRCAACNDGHMVSERDSDARPYDAVLLVSFGGPEGPDDVIPFLENVTAGRGIPRERLAEVGEHYTLFGGRSPINDLNRRLLDDIRSDFAANGLDLRVYWGNRNWDPYLRDTVLQMEADGVRRVACFLTSAYRSYSSCRQYRENLFAASVGTQVRLDRLRQYYNHPGFIGPFVEATKQALSESGPEAHVLFVTHSIPDAMNDASGGPGVGAYRAEHEFVAETIARECGAEQTSLVYCSRSGSPRTPWLEPDVNDRLEELAASGVTSVVLVPIGFVSDHMEVVYDLDTEAAATADRLGLNFIRVATPQQHPDFIAMVRDLVLERASVERGERTERSVVASGEAECNGCPIDCCLSPDTGLQTVP